jgi:hypothetical protein
VRGRYWAIGLSLILLGAFSHVSAEPVAQSLSHNSLSMDAPPSLFPYRETLTLSLKTMEDTWVPEIGVAHTSYGFDAYYVRFHKRYWGDNIPDNTVGNGLRSRIPERVWAVESMYGYTWASPTLLSLAVTTFGGIGYAAGNRNLNLEEGLIGEDYRWFYGTAGFRADWVLSPRLRVSPEIALKVPFAVASPLRTQDGDELKLPFSPAVDVTLPMTYRFPSNWTAYLTGMVERVYGAQGPTEILSSGGVPLGHLSGTSTQQLSVNFGFTYPF